MLGARVRGVAMKCRSDDPSCVPVLGKGLRNWGVEPRNVDVRPHEKKAFELPWHEASPPNHRGDKVNSDQ